jgi:hypothetical protein
MTPEEEHDYQEAIRLIQAVAENKRTGLDLGGLERVFEKFDPPLAKQGSSARLREP